MRVLSISLILTSLLAISGNITAQNILSNSEIASQWKKKNIVVKNGGQSPNIITLLQAFQNTNPTWVVKEVLKRVPAIKDGNAWESKDDYRVLVDRKNGYVDLSSETDMDQMQACVWRKDNGHKIFAVSLNEQHAPIPDLLCWYDYNPQTQTMKPEKSPLDDFTPDLPSAIVSCNLPRKGTDLEIYEYYTSLPAFKNIYKWNKKEFQIEETQIADFEYKESAASSTSQPISKSGYPWTNYSLLDLTDSGDPILVLCHFIDGDIADMMMIADYKGQHVSLGVNSQEGETIHVYRVPSLKNGDKRVAVVHRDKAGGIWYQIIGGNNVMYVVSDLPNFAHPGGARIVEIAEGFGSSDETTDIIHQLGEEIDYSSMMRLSPLTILEGEEEEP